VGSAQGVDNKEIVSVWRRVADDRDKQSIRDARILKFASVWVRGFWSNLAQSARLCKASNHWRENRGRNTSIYCDIDIDRYLKYIAISISISIIVTALSFSSLCSIHTHKQTKTYAYWPRLTDDSVHLFNVYPAFDWPSLLLSPPSVRVPQPWQTVRGRGANWTSHSDWRPAWIKDRVNRRRREQIFLAFSCSLVLLGLHSIRCYMHFTYKLMSFECRPTSILTQLK